MLEPNIPTISTEELFALDGESRLELYLRTEQSQLAVEKIARLTGDASTRQYFRLYTPDQTLIAAIYQTGFDAVEHPFCVVNNLFATAQLPVPAIIAASGDFGIILLEDLGDLRLQDWLQTALPEQYRSAYCEAIDLIFGIQAATPHAIEINCCAAQLAFDEAKLMWELEFFYKHYFQGYLQLLLPTMREAALMAELREIASTLAARPRLLCHRDFHSRNLMLWQGRQYIIDHQDARMGPQSYDLASLLRDPYVALDEEMIAELYHYFVTTCRQQGATAAWEVEMRSEFELMTVQRVVKAIGTYAYQTTVMKNNVYVPYIPRAVTTALAAAERLGQFPELRTLLAEQARAVAI
ncbi:MAG: phosphotransferase [Acidobacteriota bacterium]